MKPDIEIARSVKMERFDTDSEEELETVRRHCKELHVGCALNNAFAECGKGAENLARLVAETVERHPSEPLRFTYDDTDSTETKIEKVAKEIHGANLVTYSSAARSMLKSIREMNMEHYPRLHRQDAILLLHRPETHRRSRRIRTAHQRHDRRTKLTRQYHFA